MSRPVVITGMGLVTTYGVGVEALWDGICSGQSAIKKLDLFDPSGFKSQIGSQVPDDFKVNKIVPKHYRKATKVMARDITLAVGAADDAVKHANVITPGLKEGGDGEPTYPGPRIGAQIGSMLIAADIDELVGALATAKNEAGEFDIQKWGTEGIENLTPLWMLKFLPNMLACHVTILHDAQGPSNTITCAEASSGLSINEACRVINRDAADICFCGGGDSKVNPMAFLRWELNNRLTGENENPASAVRPFDTAASGTAVGEAGALLLVEAEEKAKERGVKIYAKLIGHGASQSIHRESQGVLPDPAGRGIRIAIQAALKQAGLEPGDIDAIVPNGTGIPEYDQAEVNALKDIFDDGLSNIPLVPVKAYIGNSGVASGTVDLCIATKMLQEQKLPPAINVENPIDSSLKFNTSGSTQDATLTNILVYGSAIGGQNTATIIQKVD